MVDTEILSILRERFEDCMLYEAPDHNVKCKNLHEQYEEAAANWFTKCKYYTFVNFGTLFNFSLILSSALTLPSTSL